MQKRVANYVGKAEDYAPWSREAPWYWITVEGAIGILIGLYFLFSTDAASSTIRYLIAIVLIGVSAVDIVNGFRNTRLRDARPSPMTPYWLVRGGAGVAVGIVALLAEHSSDISDADARKLIGYGLLAYGVIGVIGNIETLFSSHFPWMGLIGNALAVLLGVALIYNNQEAVEGDKATRYLGYAALAGGLILAGYSFLVKRGQDEAASTPVVTSSAEAPSLETLASSLTPPSDGIDNVGSKLTPPRDVIDGE